MKLASSLLSEGMGVETLHYRICPVPSSLRSTADYTCPPKAHVRWNADGAPCYLSYTDDQMRNLLNTQCFIPINEDRRIWYTSADRSRWGYCDCSLDSQWSRPFEMEVCTTQSSGTRYFTTDDLHLPLDGIACSNGRNDGKRGISLQVQSEYDAMLTIRKYGEWHEWYSSMCRKIL